MEKELRKKYFNLCNPYATLPIDSEMVLDIDNYKIDGKKVNARGRVWAEDIADKIYWSNEPQTIYFTGYAGSGKSTELHRIMNLLEKEDEANLLPVYINGLDFFDIHSKVELVDVLSVLVYKTTLEVAKYIGKEDDEFFEDSDFFKNIWKFLSQDVTIKSMEFSVAPAKIVFEMKNRSDFRRVVKHNINANITNFKNDVFKEIARLNDIVKSYEKNKKRKSGIIIVLDSLERNRGIGDQIGFVAEATEILFKDKESLELPCSVIYTIPPYLSTRGIKGIYFLPVVRVFKQNDEPYEDGIEVMKTFVYDRIPKDEIETLITEEMLKKVILFSGGYPRDLLDMLQKLLIFRVDTIKQEHIESVFTSLQNEYQEIIPMNFKDKLVDIHKTKSLNISENDNEGTAYELFSNHVILRYKNGHLWFGLHPATMRILDIKKSDG